MFVIAANNGKFYNGRVGEGWLGDKASAFTYSSRELAERKANSFNGMTPIHKMRFMVREA